MLIPVQRAQIIAVLIGRGLLCETVIFLAKAPLHASVAHGPRLCASQIILSRSVRLRKPGNARGLLLLRLQVAIVEVIFSHSPGRLPLPLLLTLLLTIFSSVLPRVLPLVRWFE